MNSRATHAPKTPSPSAYTISTQPITDQVEQLIVIVDVALTIIFLVDLTV